MPNSPTVHPRMSRVNRDEIKAGDRALLQVRVDDVDAADVYIPGWGYARHADVLSLEALRDVLRDLVDPNEWHFDHNGYCQEHGWLTDEPRARIREHAPSLPNLASTPNRSDERDGR